MEATVLSVGKSVVNGAVSYAQSAVAEEVALQLGVQRDQAFIRDELEMMQSFLMVAHDDRDDNKVVKTWVKQVRDLGYDVEDCLQDFAVRLEKPSYWWHILRTLLDRRHVAVEMKDLRAKVEDVSQRNLRYHLIKSPAAGSKSVATAAEQYAAGSKASATMYGVDEARRAMKPRVDLAQLISKEQGKDLRVIAVWGTCGVIGQVSVIRKVYDDSDKFECRAWVKLTHPFDPIMFMQSIMRQFYGYSSISESAAEGQSCPESASTTGAEVLKKMLMMKQKDLVDKFTEYVNKKSYLIVLNNLCSIEDWDWIRTYFPASSNGNRIIVATQQVEVASLCVGRKYRVSELKQLSADQTLYVFYHKSPQGGSDSMEPESSSNTTAIVTTNRTNSLVPTSEIPAGDQAKDATTGQNAVMRSLSRILSRTALLKESEVVGRVTEKNDILQLIVDPVNKEVRVISVWGMGGIGKTALVKDICESQELSGTFKKRACVTIMRPFNQVQFLRSLIMQLVVTETSEENGTVCSLGRVRKTLPWAVEKLEAELGSLLEEKRWLIVLDDLSSTTELDIIMKSLPCTENASRIIVTTREENIANHCSKKVENVYKLKGLTKKHALVVFTKKVFKENGCLHLQYPELVEQAEQILKKCSGLPLAIVAIGGFLANQPKTVMEWRKLNENLSSELEMNTELDTIRTVLLKSYDGLPYHLKACFLYLAIFPEGYKISLTRLVRRWIAEGYSRPVRGKSSSEIAESYFMDLISRSMILPSRSSSHSRKVVDSCQLHDVIREIGISKSMEENLVFRLEEGCTLNSQGTIRHLSVSNNWDGDESEFESTVDLSRVRSITIFGKWRPFFISDKMRLLRVLDLESTSGLVDHHLEHIGKLFHLRYLSLRGCHGIYHLPGSLGNLRQLQTLDVTGTNIIKLPKNIIKLRKLQHVHARGVGNNDDSVYQEYPNEVPKLTRNKLCILTCSSVGFCVACCAPHLLKGCMGIDGDTNRRDVCTACCCSFLPMLATRRCSRGVEMPRGIHRFKALQTLGVVNVSRRKATLRELASLTGLRKLGVTGVDESNAGELCSALANLSSLETLLVQSEGKPGLSGCLDGLSSPPENLVSLKLYGNLVKLPAWINGGWLKNLAKLKLRTSRIEDHDAAIQVFGSLPNLAILRLRKESFEGKEVHLHFQQGAFQTLMVLELSSPGNLKSVRFDKGAAPKLELLQYYDQPKEEVVSEENGDQFEEAPGVSFSGLAFLGSLKEVLLEGGNYKGDFVQNLRSQLELNLKRPVLKMD
ncbi:Disease resistance protein RPM1 [Triticum urartu]|uniref:Disease resistance protein RPM1 n=2 Tax=Triticum urartu TaxID=4572 RepID=M7YDZ0_TRIUA|nr:Disease resistance protein RPM1 [Triticum urartu]